MGRIAKAAAEMKMKHNFNDENSQFLFGSKGEILFSDDDGDVMSQSPMKQDIDSTNLEVLSATHAVLHGNDSLNFTKVGSSSIDSKRAFGVSTNLAMKTTFQSSTGE